MNILTTHTIAMLVCIFIVIIWRIKIFWKKNKFWKIGTLFRTFVYILISMASGFSFIISISMIYYGISKGNFLFGESINSYTNFIPFIGFVILLISLFGLILILKEKK